MKKVYLYLAVVLGLTYSCSSGGGGDDAPEQPTVNTAPTTPTQVYPLNNTICIDNTIDFQWDASSDLDNDRISYRIEVSEKSDFSSSVQANTINNNTAKIILDKGKSFYWRVKALDNKGGESAFSSVSHFLTEGEGVSNHLPFVAELVAPKIDEVINGTSVTLSWSASDVDGDTLTFDVYLDTNSEPTTKVSENQSGTTFDVTGLAASSIHYFKVVVKDANGGVTVGQVWSFKTL